SEQSKRKWSPRPRPCRLGPLPAWDSKTQKKQKKKKKKRRNDGEYQRVLEHRGCSCFSARLVPEEEKAQRNGATPWLRHALAQAAR
ncbi:MAG: hypothetical protein AB2556_25015, partial [Candidatus Thiodiazotropha sp.]